MRSGIVRFGKAGAMREVRRAAMMVLLFAAAAGAVEPDRALPREPRAAAAATAPSRLAPALPARGTAPRVNPAGVPSVVAVRRGAVAESWYVIESGPVHFDEVISGGSEEAPAALRIRVFSNKPWTLKLIPRSPLSVAEHGETVSLSRLTVRSHMSGGFSALEQGQPTVLARGGRTGGGGQLVVVDLKLKLAPNDPIGHYGCELGVMLEVM